MSVGTISTHTSLLTRLAEGTDKEAWREFCDRYAELIRAFVRRQGLQPADCDEILQEVLLALTKNLPGFEYDPAKGKFRSYLKTIAVRTVAGRLCKKRGPLSLEEIDTATRTALGDAAVEDAWETQWRQYHIRRAMAALRAEFKEPELTAFEAYAVEGRDAGEVARTMGMSAGYVYTIKSRILSRLRELVRQQVDEEG